MDNKPTKDMTSHEIHLDGLDPDFTSGVKTTIAKSDSYLRNHDDNFTLCTATTKNDGRSDAGSFLSDIQSRTSTAASPDSSYLVEVNVTVSMLRLTGIVSQSVGKKVDISDKVPKTAFISFKQPSDSASLIMYFPSGPVKEVSCGKRKRHIAVWQDENSDSDREKNAFSFSKVIDKNKIAEARGNVPHDEDADWTSDVTVHESEIMVGLVREGEMITLGRSSLVITGEPTKSLVYLPVDADYAESGMLRKKTKWKNFGKSPFQRYCVESNSAVLIYLDVGLRSQTKGASSNSITKYCIEKHAPVQTMPILPNIQSYDSSIFSDILPGEKEKNTVSTSPTSINEKESATFHRSESNLQSSLEIKTESIEAVLERNYGVVCSSYIDVTDHGVEIIMENVVDQIEITSEGIEVLNGCENGDISDGDSTVLPTYSEETKNEFDASKENGDVTSLSEYRSIDSNGVSTFTCSTVFVSHDGMEQIKEEENSKEASGFSSSSESSVTSMTLDRYATENDEDMPYITNRPHLLSYETVTTVGMESTVGETIVEGKVVEARYGERNIALV